MSYVSQIHEYRGKQDLYIRQKPVELNRLNEIAKIQSTESSNSIEGIVTTKPRLKELMADKTTPRNRDEEEILGYRNVLELIHENYEMIPVRPNYILQLHGELLKFTTFSYIEKAIADTQNSYYDALAVSDQGWHAKAYWRGKKDSLC